MVVKNRIISGLKTQDSRLKTQDLGLRTKDPLIFGDFLWSVKVWAGWFCWHVLSEKRPRNSRYFTKYCLFCLWFLFNLLL
ncbi:MAG: hypothetical protein HFP77_04360 [Methylococcales symbiont of Iophon sp. n. MRB-2018]|nr:MAG: hypothetical protein HFP77_04360 [Methylococcales symbiont of Iophon sp. n. MRB-2018]KAF3980084.1 MAG: hypothetical protein HFP76_03860 [Methylococcales symbiont of Iophon sp. n. MRB-2018]